MEAVGCFVLGEFSSFLEFLRNFEKERSTNLINISEQPIFLIGI